MGLELFKLLGTIAIDNKTANDAIDETTGKASDSQGKMSSAFSKVGSGAVAFGKTVLKGMAVAGAGVATLAGAAVNSFASYEQLVGGVDTLFKDSSKKVQEYAKNAYKTAGMSANEYMDTVTSFSASLLQSLDGDTAKAAEKANMAITDMSDNANKMGTSMESIQNAYQGFAKQNFTMLDNLKLGYGGTKEEMQRLLEDAEKLSGVKYDISSYADIVDAIHVVQEEMGIAGTTAQEAADTISGSFSSMKGSWQNLLTAIASDDLPFDEYVNAFVESTSNVVKNMMPRISTALEGVVQLIDKVAPIIINKIPELFSTLLPSVITAATGLISSIVQALPAMVDMLTTSVIPQLISGVVSVFGAIVEALPTLMESIVSALPTLIPQLINGLVSMIVLLCTNFTQIIQPLLNSLPAIIISIVNALMSNLPILIQGAVSLVVNLVSALPQIILSLVQAMPTVIKSLVQGLWTAAPLLIQGMRNIWENVRQAVINVVKGLVSTVVDWCIKLKDMAVEKFTELKSRAGEKFNEIKTNAVEKFNALKTGITDKITAIKNSVIEKFEAIKNGIRDKIEGAKEKVRAAIDKIKGFFDFKWELPKLKLPHFDIKGKFSLNPPSVPKLSIDWYAKAMNAPRILNDATIFGYNSNTDKFLGGGERGSELVGGTNTVMNMIQNAVNSANGAVEYYLKQLIAILAEYFPEILEAIDRPVSFNPDRMAAALAYPMDRELGRLKERKDRGR